MRGIVAPGVIIPLHCHADPETFIQLSGELEALSDEAGEHAWTRIRPGDVFHVPGGARHAFRNRASEPAISIIVTTPRLGSFLHAIGVPAARRAGAPSPERIEQFLTTAEKYGYWNASPEENARFGLDLLPAGPQG
jgi:uncharacterized protein YaiE (UPF0345 family)